MIANLGHFDPALLSYRPAQPLSDAIIDKVGEHFNVPVWRLLGAQRSQHVAYCRQVAMYLLRECTDLSYPAIGSLLGRDHSTCLYAHRLIEARMAASGEFRARIEALKLAVEG